MIIQRRILLSLLTGAALGCAKRRTRGDHPFPTMRISKASLVWMEEAATKSIQGCRQSTPNGIPLYTPDGVGNYSALWTRDFYYMLQLFDRFDPQEARAAIAYLVEGVREDGVAPDRRQRDGITVYEAGGLGNPVALPPLDNAAFLVSLVYLYTTHTRDVELLSRAMPVLDRSMRAIPRSESGLVWNDPKKPHSPYGFTDTVGKTGELLFCSVLDWKASKELVHLSTLLRDHERRLRYQTVAQTIEQNIFRLQDAQTGLFFAASQDCRQIDVWGNAFITAAGFPLPEDTRKSIRTFFANRYDEVIEKGQVRHLVEHDYWERMLIDIKPGEYQNGGYWGTPSGWVMATLAAEHPRLAEQTWNDLVLDYQTRGIHEWVNGEVVRLPHYVASVTNPLASMRLLIQQGVVQVI